MDGEASAVMVAAWTHHHCAVLKADDARRADIALKGIRGKRLTYRRTNETRYA